MTTQEVANRLVEMCSQGQFMEAIETLYANDVVSVEAMAMPGMPREMSGLEAVVAKGRGWLAEHEVHSGKVEGPLVAGSHFCVRFTFDVTPRKSGNRMTMDELAMYEVKDGKVVREEFFYSM